MKKINSIAILFIFILSLSISACAKRNTEDISKDANKNNNLSQNINENSNINENQNSNKNKILSKEEYKDLLVKNYEKYLGPIDIRDEKLDDILDKNNDLDNEELITNYKNLIIDSKNNIKSFEDSIKNVKVEDSNLQNLNDKLVSDLNNIIEDIILKEDSISSLDVDLINGNKKALMEYLDKEFDKDSQNEKKLEDTLEKIENLIGIDLSK